MTGVLINGEFKETINVFDRGLHYGDGLFETMAVRNGKINLWNAHWQRLSLGCKKLSINLPNKEIIENEIALLDKNNRDRQGHYIVKLIVTRGIGERGYRYPNKQNITRILTTHSWPNYPDEFLSKGVALRYCETTLSKNSQLAGIKHLNRLEQVLARNEWDTDEFQEGLMLTDDGHVVDGTMSNIFAVKDNMIFTPDLSLCGVEGVMRKTVVEIAKTIGFSVYEKNFTQAELEQADELFLTNSIFGIWPVRIIAKTRFTKMGIITKQIQDKLVELIK
ncbi:MAG: aminodeoxychorismate lyase [Gammaproteobacteria bacterium]|nr:aminodeoxychorismate lyase [Gammaproteobacteria bacterium]MCW8988906.1 aminodeoxychorismate lyase [Gammaproteobacteria bacterium]MCW9031727.1 aminodeoxychorismate lyase [Gammaproteobacteria bacterium]